MVAAALACVVLLARGAEGYFFYSLGDWGGDSDSHPTTQVEINNAQGMVSTAASGVLSASTPHFAMLVGDNFYSSGIQGDEFSPRFNATFESAFPSSEPALAITRCEASAPIGKAHESATTAAVSDDHER